MKSLKDKRKDVGIRILANDYYEVEHFDNNEKVELFFCDERDIKEHIHKLNLEIDFLDSDVIETKLVKFLLKKHLGDWEEK